MQSNMFFLSLVKLSAASEPDPSNPFVHQRDQVGSTRKLWFHPWEADESSLNGLRASRPKGGRERERRQGGRAPAAVARTIVIKSLVSLLCVYLPTVLTYCIYILAFYSVHTARSRMSSGPREAASWYLSGTPQRRGMFYDSKDGNDTSRISSPSPSIPPIESPLRCRLPDTYKSAGTRT